MSESDSHRIHRLTPADHSMMNEMLTLFGNAFEDADHYCSNRPGEEYTTRLLGNDHFIALAALKYGAVVGGLAAYELPKFEQERSEIYIYDLAVDAGHRREGVATALIGALKPIARSRKAHVIYVQADKGDEPAIALYTGLGVREDVLHFDIV